MATTCYLPEEIIFFILSSFLPVKSLVQYSLVCKSWQSIISSTDFIQTHLRNSEKKQPSSVLNCGYVDQVVYIDTGKDSVKLRWPSRCNDYISICSCNGLVCLAGLSKLCIWNPSTRRFKILPAANKRTQYFEPGIGFGFDPVSSDYKILRFVFDMDYKLHNFVREAELYSANDDSWKYIEIPKTLPEFSPFRSSKCYTKNGIVYMEGYGGVLSFDLKNEEFGLYPYPDHIRQKSRIFDIEGSIAKIFSSFQSEGSVQSLWMLEDIGGKLSWTEKFNLDVIHKEHYGVECLYLGDGQFVTLNDGGYIYYDNDSKTKEIRKFDPPRRNGTSIINYTKSLVSLKGFEKQE